MKLPRRTFLKAGASSVAWMAAVGCDQLPRELRALFPPAANTQGLFHPPAQETLDPIVHALNRSAFGPRPGDYERVSNPTPRATNETSVLPLYALDKAPAM